MIAVSFSGRAGVAEYNVLPGSTGHGAAIATRGKRLSGRPSCRIYPVGGGWGLELERTSAWLADLPFPGGFRFFKSLAGAVGFAEAHDLDYRIIRPTPFFIVHRRRPSDASKLRGRRRLSSMRSSKS
jgi:hypothetical protein